MFSQKYPQIGRGFVRLLLCSLASLALAQSARGEETLAAKYGLKRLPASNIWVVPLEMELRDQWAELPGQRDAIHALDQGLSERVRRNANDWAAAARSEPALRARIAALSPNDSTRRTLEQQLSALRNGLSAPEHLADQPQVREQLIELAERRNALWLTAQTIRHKTRLLTEEYMPLIDQPDVAALLKKAGAGHRLGPARDYGSDIKKLADYEKLFLTTWIPAHSIGERHRVTLIVNETTPTTFTWTTSPEPTLITAAMAEAAAIHPTADAKEQTISIDRRTYRARPAKLAYLQVGKYQLREIDVFVLPPEAESAGARIGPAAFEGYRVELQPTRLRLSIAPLTSLGAEK